MNPDIETVTAILPMADKLGVTGFMFLVISYLVWKDHHQTKILIDSLTELKHLNDKTNQIFRETKESNDEFRKFVLNKVDTIEDDIVDVKKQLHFVTSHICISSELNRNSSKKGIDNGKF